jgi:AcrR family transcriptional regulator
MEGTMAQSHLPAEYRRRQFIDAAIVVISHEGMAKATTRRIAEVAELPYASLHYCFATKEDLLQAVYETAAASGFAEVGLDVTPRVGLHQGIEDITRSFAKWIRRSRDIQLALYELAVWSLRNPASSHLATRVYRRYIDGCAQLLREVSTEQEADFDVDMLAHLLVSAMDGFTLQWLTLDDASGVRVIEASVRMLQSAVPAAQPAS